MKCLPRSKISMANGVVLHDWHAEILAIRAFNRFLIDECADLATAGLGCSDWLSKRPDEELTEHEFQPYGIKDGVRIHMYCSEAPCGDASMELVMRSQEDATPWPVPLPIASLDGERETPQLRGRSHFSELGVVRRKPGELFHGW
jgi:tRNA-specific adenosine deaminase 1